MKNIWTSLLILLIATGCNNQSIPEITPEVEKANSWKSGLRELSDEEYPDNPDIGRSHAEVLNIKFDSIEFMEKGSGKYDVYMVTEDGLDTVFFPEMSLLEFIPTIQERFRGKDYLSHIAVVNQEWNRNQVRFSPDLYTSTTNSLQKMVRIDIARNCLNTYLWEVIGYAEEDGKTKAYYHGWFNFPKELFAVLFEKRNQISFDTYAGSMVDWIDPENRQIPIEGLRTVLNEKTIEFTSHNDEEYLRTGERDKKFQNIIYPKNTTKIQDFLTDSTLFATFSPPGFYNTKDPRTTELSRLSNPGKIDFREVQCKQICADTLHEIEITFNVGDSVKETKLILSGLHLSDIPTLDSSEVNKGWQSSMGFANHTFYESYEHAQSCKVKDNPYFAFLTDANDKWMDSHQVGIDGPLMYFDKKDPEILHVLLLSFERHAIVGHYSFRI